MFKVSFEWLSDFLRRKISLDEVLEILNLQGFEVKTIEEINNDNVITIEVKANRPDMLSHIGVAREINSFLSDNFVEDERSEFTLENGLEDDKYLKDNKISEDRIENSEFPIEIEIEENTSERFSAIAINNIDNNVSTPEIIKRRLETLGINTVNPVVDLSNYIMLEWGQPTHVYDLDKISGKKVFVKKSIKKENFLTLADKNFEVSLGDIVIKDSEGIVCMAGIIGSQRVETDFNSKNIIIESACFEKIAIRTTSRRSHVSTPASLRFERGVNCEKSLKIAKILAHKIIKLCGGEIQSDFDFREEKSDFIDIKLRLQRVNNILGTSLNFKEMKKCLNKYGFVSILEDSNELTIRVPSFRLDINEEIDLIEEVARSFGYNNIKPKNLITEVVYRENEVYSAGSKIRNILVGLGCNEVITYSFIPDNTMQVLGIDDNSELLFGSKNVFLNNPISNFYSLMRPTLVFSLVNNLAHNYSVGNSDLVLFELGRIYFKDPSSDTGCSEFDTLGIIMSGNRINRGWGIKNDVKFDFYDINSFVKILYNEFGQNFKFIDADYPFLIPEKNISENEAEHRGFEIRVNNEYAGFLGEINTKKFAELAFNTKLIKNQIFYCEILVKSFHDLKKTLKFESKFPSVIRQYNFMCPKTIPANKIEMIIKKSSKIVQNIEIKDIYEGKETLDNSHFLLFEVIYRLPNRTLTTEEIENTERIFLDNLQNINIIIKRV
ncbi:MAG: phenylalanine--tRNA ligase subunit beta [Oscillospiraceae bacterium]|nr:phenylalanine--tRNA ligase subunit beta [Oscillospiraceae bacterium]